VKGIILNRTVKHVSLVLNAKFDGNLLTSCKVIVEKLLPYFFVDTV